MAGRRRPTQAPEASARRVTPAEVLAVRAAIRRRVVLCERLAGLAAVSPCCGAVARAHEQIRAVLPALDGLVLGERDLDWLTREVERIGRELLAHVAPAGRA